MLKHAGRPEFLTATWHGPRDRLGAGYPSDGGTDHPRHGLPADAGGFERSQHGTLFALLFVFSVLATFVLHVMTFPFLWKNPIGPFHRRFSRHGRLLAMAGRGILFRAYVDGCKTPLALCSGLDRHHHATIGSALFIIGAFLVRSGWDMVIMGLALAPVAAVIALHSVQYDGWRHLYFIYPFMVLTAVKSHSGSGAKSTAASPDCSAAGAACHFILIVTWMVFSHPYQMFISTCLRAAIPPEFRNGLLGSGQPGGA